ncbi:MAG: GNAT family N-acetyltransferase [bacterium]
MADAGHIRRADFQDVPVIYDIIKENQDEVLPRSIPDILAMFDRFYLYDDGEVRGVISWQVLPVMDLKDPEFCLEVISFSVRPSDQGKGIGTVLLNHVLGILKEFGPDRIVVLTFHSGFFEKFGFKKTSKEYLYPKIYLGCINCTKYKSPLTCPEVAMEIKTG